MNYFGATGLVTKDSGTIVRDRYGMDKGTVVFQCRQDGWASHIPALGSAHPYAAWLACEKVAMTISPGIVLFACEYAGVNGATEPVYELEIGCSDEPIETHPKFVSDIGGSPASPSNGAIFVDVETGSPTDDDTKGVFSRFTIIDGGVKNRFAGVSKYLDASQVTWTKTQVTTTRPTSVSIVGLIGTPAGSPPSLGSGRNWLYIGLGYEERGGGTVFKVKQSWRASRLGGWITAMYTA